MTWITLDTISINLQRETKGGPELFDNPWSGHIVVFIISYTSNDPFQTGKCNQADHISIDFGKNGSLKENN